MGKGLSFCVDSKDFYAEPKKIDRKKLYGWQEKVAYDESGGVCSLGYTDESGTLILPRGGVGLGILSPEGEWVERSNLKAVRLDGSLAERIPSSYSGKIILDKRISPEEFLNHSISAAYFLGEDNGFFSAVGSAIFSFPYIYRDGYETTAAFVLQSGGNLFMLLGTDNNFEMLTLNQVVDLDEEGEDETDEDEDELDFSMI
ncbi:hypothetical protein FACS189450_01850 [Spirochaetia bacterium]|nr:hypothetical protein FACS189450_01850 [Spirochaetia bacterium]